MHRGDASTVLFKTEQREGLCAHVACGTSSQTSQTYAAAAAGSGDIVCPNDAFMASHIAISSLLLSPSLNVVSELIACLQSRTTGQSWGDLSFVPRAWSPFYIFHKNLYIDQCFEDYQFVSIDELFWHVS